MTSMYLVQGMDSDALISDGGDAFKLSTVKSVYNVVPVSCARRFLLGDIHYVALNSIEIHCNQCFEGLFRY